MPPFAYGDVVAPMFATLAVLAALEQRRVTGEGQHLDVSQVEPLVHVLGDVLARGQLTGDFTRLANGSVSMAPHGVYPARGIDQWIAIAVPDDAAWRALAALAGLDAEQYPTLERRMVAAGEIDTALGAWTSGQDKHVLADRLAAAGVAAEAARSAGMTMLGHIKVIDLTRDLGAYAGVLL
eukprot:gene68203-93456_t